MEACSLRVQIVLYENEFEPFVLTIQGLIAAAALAKANGSLSRVELAIGDCSPARALTIAQEEGLLRNALSNGFDAATYEFFEENLGSAGGSNRLAEGATTDYILVLNPDTYPSPWMLDHMLGAFGKDIGLVDARQLPVEHPKEFNPDTGDVSWASGACSMFDRRVFEEVGGYDTDHFFLHCDDVDVSWRIRLAGYRVITAPEASVLHHKSVSAGGSVVIPAVERYYGVLGRLMLATRYGADDVADRTTRWIENHGDEVQQQALDEFHRRKSDGRVPEAIENADRVAQFVGNEFARHRF